MKKKWGTQNHHLIMYPPKESLNFADSLTHSHFPVLRWGYLTKKINYYWMKLSVMWRIMHNYEGECYPLRPMKELRWITASYKETVKCFEWIIMGFTLCICASLGRIKIWEGHHWHVLVVIFIFLFGTHLWNASERLQVFILLVLNYMYLYLTRNKDSSKL